MNSLSSPLFVFNWLPSSRNWLKEINLALVLLRPHERNGSLIFILLFGLFYTLPQKLAVINQTRDSWYRTRQLLQCSVFLQTHTFVCQGLFPFTTSVSWIDWLVSHSMSLSVSPLLCWSTYSLALNLLPAPHSSPFPLGDAQK